MELEYHNKAVVGTATTNQFFEKQTEDKKTQRQEI